MMGTDTSHTIPRDRAVQAAIAASSRATVFSLFSSRAPAPATATDALSINGAPASLQSGQGRALPGGAAVWRNGPVYSVWTPAGDITNLRDQGKYLNITGRISPLRRSQRVKGSLGCFDIDRLAWNDLVLRDGTVTADVPLFLRNWRTTAAESVF